MCSKQKLLKNLSSLQRCLFETSRIIIIEVRRFCISMYSERRLILHHNFRSFKYLPIRFCLQSICCPEAPHLLITLRSGQLPSVYNIEEHRNSLMHDHLCNVLTLRMITFSQGISMYFGSVNTGELPTSECNQ